MLNCVCYALLNDAVNDFIDLGMYTSVQIPEINRNRYRGLFEGLNKLNKIFYSITARPVDILKFTHRVLHLPETFPGLRQGLVQEVH